MKKNQIFSFLLIASTLFVFSCTGKKSGKLPDSAKLNQFFTAISSCNTSEFKKDAATDEILINFGVYYNYKNYQKELFKDKADNLTSISQKSVADTASKYFGKTISANKSFEEIKFENNSYNIQNASGDVYLFSQVKKIEETGKDEYTVNVEVYSASSGWTSNVNATPEAWKKESPDDVPELSTKMKATIKRVQTGGKESFVLLSYVKE